MRQVQAPGGVNQRAIAAIENALLDIKGKALGVPVYELFGGPVRERIPVYWSHCGTYRVRNRELVGVKPLRTYDDVGEARRGGEGARLQGAEDQHPAVRGDGKLDSLRPGLRPLAGLSRAQSATASIAAGGARQLQAFRDGAGPEMGLHLDVNFHFKTEGFLAGRARRSRRST